MEAKGGATQTEDILNSILPPREWTEDAQLWVQARSRSPALGGRQPRSAASNGGLRARCACPSCGRFGADAARPLSPAPAAAAAQYVASTPATRLDVISLQERLDQQLQQRQVRARARTR